MYIRILFGEAEAVSSTAALLLWRTGIKVCDCLSFIGFGSILPRKLYQDRRKYAVYTVQCIVFRCAAKFCIILRLTLLAPCETYKPECFSSRTVNKRWILNTNCRPTAAIKRCSHAGMFCVGSGSSLAPERLTIHLSPEARTKSYDEPLNGSCGSRITTIGTQNCDCTGNCVASLSLQVSKLYKRHEYRDQKRNRPFDFSWNLWCTFRARRAHYFDLQTLSSFFDSDFDTKHQWLNRSILKNKHNEKSDWVFEAHAIDHRKIVLSTTLLCLNLLLQIEKNKRKFQFRLGVYFSAINFRFQNVKRIVPFCNSLTMF